MHKQGLEYITNDRGTLPSGQGQGQHGADCSTTTQATICSRRADGQGVDCIQPSTVQAGGALAANDGEGYQCAGEGVDAMGQFDASCIPHVRAGIHVARRHFGHEC